MYCTIVPDINLIFEPFFPFPFRNITHSLLGLVILTIPLTIIFTIIFCTYIGPFLSTLANKDTKTYKPLKYFGLNEWNNLKKKKYNKRFFIVASYSALIGGVTHLLLDLPAHAIIELFFPIILQSPDILLYSLVDFGPINIGPIQIDRNLTVYGLIWISETVIMFVLALYLLRYIKKRNLINKWYGEI